MFLYSIFLLSFPLRHVLSPILEVCEFFSSFSPIGPVWDWLSNADHGHRGDLYVCYWTVPDKYLSELVSDFWLSACFVMQRLWRLSGAPLCLSNHQPLTEFSPAPPHSPQQSYQGLQELWLMTDRSRVPSLIKGGPLDLVSTWLSVPLNSLYSHSFSLALTAVTPLCQGCRLAARVRAANCL